MIVRSFVAAAVLAAAAHLSADTLAEMKSALRGLHPKQPIRAIYETKSTNVARGRFFDQDASGAGSVEARLDDDGLTIVYPRAMLDRAMAQRRAKNDSKAQRVSEVSATHLVELLDYAPVLASILDRASVVEEHAATVDSQPARLIILDIRKEEQPEIKSGHFDVKFDRLSLWIGADGLPLLSERASKFAGGILFLKAEGASKDKLIFARRDDRLIVLRLEHTDSSSGMGQTSNNAETETITLR
jgi:hypothetical protein